jgi:TusA-related sulfurtransferase
LKIKPDHILDLRGAIPPITLLKVSQVFREMKPQEILEILCRDPDTRTDLFKVLPPFSYELIVMEELEEESSFRVQMKKSKNF